MTRLPDTSNTGDEAPGLSPARRSALRALLSPALQRPPDAQQPACEVPFGDYVLIRELGRGGFGVVFLARHTGIHRTVALKRMRDGEFATPADMQRFVEGAAAAADLEHPNIVPVFHVGEREGRPFFTMKYVEGGSLADLLQQRRPTEPEAARWVAKIARAIQHAHERGILHRDLKPANILIDATDEPYVADFGLAKRLGEVSRSETSRGAGAPYYMAPEQLSGDSRKLTTAADIYGLGVIFYELLTGEVPYQGLEVTEWRQELAHGDAVCPPREVNRHVNPELESICLKCLEKRPELRYRSAAALADDLELVLDGFQPSVAIGVRSPSRLLRWMRRRPLRSIAALGVVLFALLGVLAAYTLWRADAEQRRAALETNAFIASSQAGAMLLHFRELADRVEVVARHPSLRTLLASGSPSDTLPFDHLARAFGTLALLRSDGELIVQYPRRRFLGQRYRFRSYFEGARVLAERGLPGAYVSRAYRGEHNDRLQFAFSAPVFAERGAWAGVVVAVLEADSAFGQLRLQDSAESGRIVALLGPRDRERATSDAPRPSGYFFLVHPELGRGREVALAEPEAGALQRAFELPDGPGSQFVQRWVRPLSVPDFHDPLSAVAEPFLAALAPVGQTGYVALVQTRREAASRPTRALIADLAWRVGIPFAAGLMLLSLLTLRAARRPRRLIPGRER